MTTTRYIALLRGVNVGDKNTISMPKLKAAFEKHGFCNVSTYINSGNIIFESELDTATTMARCEKLIAMEYELNIVVGIITADELIEALIHAPVWWDNDPTSKHNALFVIPPMTTQEVCVEIGDIKPEYEKLDSYGNVIFWSAPLETFSRTRLTQIVRSKKAYNAITIRNANTTKKLGELVRQTVR